MFDMYSSKIIQMHIFIAPNDVRYMKRIMYSYLQPICCLCFTRFCCFWCDYLSLCMAVFIFSNVIWWHVFLPANICFLFLYYLMNLMHNEKRPKEQNGILSKQWDGSRASSQELDGCPRKNKRWFAASIY